MLWYQEKTWLNQEYQSKNKKGVPWSVNNDVLLCKFLGIKRLRTHSSQQNLWALALLPPLRLWSPHAHSVPWNSVSFCNSACLPERESMNYKKKKSKSRECWWLCQTYWKYLVKIINIWNINTCNGNGHQCLQKVYLNKLLNWTAAVHETASPLSEIEGVKQNDDAMLNSSITMECRQEKKFHRNTIAICSVKSSNPYVPCKILSQILH